MNKEKLAKDIEQLKSKLDEMEKELKKTEKFEWKYPKGSSFQVGMYSVFSVKDSSSEKLLENGRYRLSEQNAMYSLERNRISNRLEALVEQLDPDYVVPEIGNHVYFILQSKSGTYSHSTVQTFRHVGQVYMRRETAIKICEMLNSGEVEL